MISTAASRCNDIFIQCVTNRTTWACVEQADGLTAITSYESLIRYKYDIRIRSAVVRNVKDTVWVTSRSWPQHDVTLHKHG